MKTTIVPAMKDTVITHKSAHGIISVVTIIITSTKAESKTFIKTPRMF